MRALPLLMRLADDMRRVALTSSPFYEDPWRLYRMVSAPWPELRQLEQKIEDSPKIGKDGYQVNVDVAEFQPNELTVKVVDNSVVVEGKHEERQDDNGYVSRQFVRRYLLPRGYDPAKVMSTLSSDGILTVSVPKPSIENKSNERLIQIQQTGPASLNVKKNPSEDKPEPSTSSDNQEKK